MKENHMLHILNGQQMYNYDKKTNFLKHETMIPFNEAMCYGITSENLFSEEFVKIRAAVHNVTPEQYVEITLKPMKQLFSRNYTEIELWFDFDMFCQINLLTILAWLDQAEFQGNIDLYLVGNHFEPIENHSLKAKGYFDLFKQVLIHKIMPNSISLQPLKMGVKLYLKYLCADSELMLFIAKNQTMPEEMLVQELLKNFQEYGLGDVQYMEIIKKQRKKISWLKTIEEGCEYLGTFATAFFFVRKNYFLIISPFKTISARICGTFSIGRCVEISFTIIGFTVFIRIIS